MLKLVCPTSFPILLESKTVLEGDFAHVQQEVWVAVMTVWLLVC